MKDLYSYIQKVIKNVINYFWNKEEDDKITLDPVKEFCENYIGVFIVGFDAFDEDIEDLEKNVSAKIIVSAEIKEDSLYLNLSTVSAKHGGYLKISPQINGQFAERNIDDTPMMTSRYRINFYGGDSVEYLDPDELGEISFHQGRL